MATGKALSAINDASEAHALAATYSDVEVEAALNALGAKVNELLDELRERGWLDK